MKPFLYVCIECLFCQSGSGVGVGVCGRRTASSCNGQLSRFNVVNSYLLALWMLLSLILMDVTRKFPALTRQILKRRLLVREFCGGSYLVTRLRLE